MRFRVPTGDLEWPEHLWGYRLGIKATELRSLGLFATQVARDSQELKRLDFCFESSIHDRNWNEKFVPALKVFRQEFGHCNVSCSFVVPSNPPWPKRAWGMRFGATVHLIRLRQQSLIHDTTELDELGFVWDYSQNGMIASCLRWKHFIELMIAVGYQYLSLYHLMTLGQNSVGTEWTERIMPSLETFYQVNDHCRVPISFVVPSGETWRKHSWGMKLGKIVNSIRSKGSYDVQVSRDKLRLEEMGFVWDFYKAEWCERILPALEVFYREYDHSRVPPGFEVPFEANWPKETHGLKLGSVAERIRLRGAYFDFTVRTIDALNAIKFDLKIPASKWDERVEPLLVVFEELHGHRDIPFEFVVPASAAWKMKDWGIPLGKLKWK
ncbi:hypothetical protein PHMEG_00035679 [Phytophthora megakarya]|uniref:Uncharacterized protein n=1 Tax=Phytophthora megakarya TaxID=4795 RepID=A0A225UNH1_9STRA|nr:hypothetical protein PHMEG_00035679 [Phytophthora megakarya]